MTRLAVTYDEDTKTVFQHFGHCSRFKIYEIDGQSILDVFEMDTDGKGHGYLPEFLYKLGVEEVICGGFGPGMGNALRSLGIKVIGGVTGDADQAVVSYINGNLDYTDNSNCSHHDHDEGHHCCGHHEDEHECCGGHDDHHCGCH